MILAKDDVKKFCEILKKSGKKIVFTNGCFDLLHAGHVLYLQKAKSFGDYLFVGLNSDSSVKKLKGDLRPINTQNDRAFVLDALACVDFVTIFEEDTAENLISLVQPDVYVKGDDYSLATLPEAKIIQSYGGKVEFVKLLQNHSTTRMIEKIRV